MGYNTTVVVRNDALTDIENDPDFGKKLASAIRDRAGGHYPVEVSAGGAAVVVETHHADIVTVVAVGQNTAEMVGAYFSPISSDDLIRRLAEDAGYVLYKKARRRR